MSKSSILIVEDDADLREALSTTLEVAGYKFIAVESAEAALDVLEQQSVELVISDVNLPGMDGHELLARVKRQSPGIPMMLMTAFGQISHAVSAMQKGAADYLVKPFEPQVLLDSIRKFSAQGVSGPMSASSAKDEPVAEDVASKRIFQLASRVAATDSTVLIAGESGTGKEVLARFIHRHSDRKDKPFVAINCAAIPENMLEAMLFGHEKGAFTGAYASAPGKFEQANGGTILLDEVSEMDLGLQAKLLRVLQEREVERVGGRRPITLDVRVIATTNRDLRSYVQEGRFREDLYYRLSVFPLQWMPLRERPADIIPLARRLLQTHAHKMKVPFVRLDEQAERALLNHPWPGNVRELDNVIQRSLILHQNGVVTAADLYLEAGQSPLAGHTTLAGHGSLTAQNSLTSQEEAVDSDWQLPEDDSALGQDLRMREFQIILDALKREGGRRKQVAEKLGISPRTLRYKLAKMRECGIDIAEELI